MKNKMTNCQKNLKKICHVYTIFDKSSEFREIRKLIKIGKKREIIGKKSYNITGKKSIKYETKKRKNIKGTQKNKRNST